MGESYHDFYVKTESKAQAAVFRSAFLDSLSAGTLWQDDLVTLNHFAASAGELQLNECMLRHQFGRWKIYGGWDSWATLFCEMVIEDPETPFVASVGIDDESSDVYISYEYNYSAGEISVQHNVFNGEDCCPEDEEYAECVEEHVLEAEEIVRLGTQRAGGFLYTFTIKTESKAQAAKFADEFLCSVESDTIASEFEKLSNFAKSGGTLRMNELALKRKYGAWKILNDERDDWSPMFAACALTDADSPFEASVVVSTVSGEFDKLLDYKYSNKELSVAEHVFAEQSMGGWCMECYTSSLKKNVWQNLIYSPETAKCPNCGSNLFETYKETYKL